MDKRVKYWGMCIPQEPFSLEIKPDPNGVPIYDKCPANGDLCACTGKCRRIIGYDTDPEKVAVYHEEVRQYNERIKKRLSSFHGNFTYQNKERGDGQIRTWAWEKPDTNK